MPRTRRPYPPEFREQLVALVRAGRTPEDLAGEFEPTAQSISNWVAQADRDAGRRTDGLTTAERTELTRLRRENRQVNNHRLQGGGFKGCQLEIDHRRAPVPLPGHRCTPGPFHP